MLSFHHFFRMSSSTVPEAYFLANGIIGLVKEVDPALHRVVDIPASHTSNSLWRRAPNAIINPPTANTLSRFKFAMWKSLTADLAPGSGCVGRAVSLTVAWGSSSTPPISESDVANLKGSMQVRFGGLQDPSMQSIKISMPLDSGEYSLIIKPQNPFGYPVLFVWVQFASGANPLPGTLVKVTFTGSLEVWTSPVRI